MQDLQASLGGWGDQGLFLVAQLPSANLHPHPSFLPILSPIITCSPLAAANADKTSDTLSGMQDIRLEGAGWSVREWGARDQEAKNSLVPDLGGGGRSGSEKCSPEADVSGWAFTALGLFR